jgi:hypothetical protein
VPRLRETLDRLCDGREMIDMERIQAIIKQKILSCEFVCLLVKQYMCAYAVQLLMENEGADTVVEMVIGDFLYSHSPINTVDRLNVVDVCVALRDYTYNDWHKLLCSYYARDIHFVAVRALKGEGCLEIGERDCNSRRIGHILHTFDCR